MIRVRISFRNRYLHAVNWCWAKNHQKQYVLLRWWCSTFARSLPNANMNTRLRKDEFPNPVIHWNYNTKLKEKKNNQKMREKTFGMCESKEKEYSCLPNNLTTAHCSDFILFSLWICRNRYVTAHICTQAPHDVLSRFWLISHWFSVCYIVSVQFREYLELFRF